MARRGAKTLLTAERLEQITTALSNGLTRETAAKYARVSYQTFYNWYTRGRAEFERLEKKIPAKRGYKIQESLYLNFFNQVEIAEADAIVEWQQVINRAARTDPVWAFKMLALRDRGYRTVDVTATYDLTKATDEQLERIANGEDPLTVMATTSQGDPRTATPG